MHVSSLRKAVTWKQTGRDLNRDLLGYEQMVYRYAYRYAILSVVQHMWV